MTITSTRKNYGSSPTNSNSSGDWPPTYRRYAATFALNSLGAKHHTPKFTASHFLVFVSLSRIFAAHGSSFISYRRTHYRWRPYWTCLRYCRQVGRPYLPHCRTGLSRKFIIPLPTEHDVLLHVGATGNWQHSICLYQPQAKTC